MTRIKGQDKSPALKGEEERYDLQFRSVQALSVPAEAGSGQGVNSILSSAVSFPFAN